MVREAATSAGLLRARAATDLWINVAGGSMAPRLVPPARVRVAAATRRPRVGEVWAFVADDRTVVVHRSIGHRGDRAAFVGDANRVRDALVRPEQLIGRAVAVDRQGHVVGIRRRDAIWPLLGWALRALRRRLATLSEG